ncbi:radical SAM protein [candidate division KSB1 bacterium]|nr:radical SAM protein [candidate division KSB1 bacterium]
MKLHQALPGQNIPLAGSIELTERCNLSCHYCYINKPAADKNCLDRELKTAEFKQLISGAAAMGCLWLLITGEEPLLRPDFAELYKTDKRKGMLVTIFTNATLLTAKLCRLFADMPPFGKVTLCARREKTYERITSIKGAHPKYLKGIDLLLQYNLPLRVKTPVFADNLVELDLLKAFTKERSLEFRFDPVLNLRTDGGKAPGQYRLSPEKVVELDCNRMASQGCLTWYRYFAKNDPAIHQKRFR